MTAKSNKATVSAATKRAQRAQATKANAPAPAKTTATAEQVAEQVAQEPKCAHGRKQVAKPQTKMLRKIAKINPHPGKALRIKRFDRYKVGMTLQQCKETEGLDHLDVLFYEEHGLMELAQPTSEEVAAAVKAWEKSKEAAVKAA